MPKGVYDRKASKQGFRGWLCLHLPWHRFVVRRRVNDRSEYLRCSCGAEYGINHDVGVIIPWPIEFWRQHMALALGDLRARVPEQILK